MLLFLIQIGSVAAGTVIVYLVHRYAYKAGFEAGVNATTSFYEGRRDGIVADVWGK